ncbi:helix-turn-helix domain-containing protein [Parendozoicomonas haliclonae]|uniref:DNA-binding transcriptional regulator SoxS n=1 Tax=Parendozoicomonas haliclonae TaxID=1960125 RepID=A0A1X7ARB8_9GAMM|nr:helix-turn-helix transcriptional regulator [Parendozoicomonas haliclonae]SMA50856.1 DNA-binding transcriptional regulator SoxS [Parendozoicomonas haliclonae]
MQLELSLYFSAIAFSAALVILNLILVLTGGYRQRSRQLFAALLFCALGYLVEPIFKELGNWFWHWVAGLLRNGLPCVFWLLCNYVFDDDFELSPAVWTAAGVVAFTSPMITLVVYQFSLPQPQWLLNLQSWPTQGVEIVMIIHALVTAARTTQADLVETRRMLRTSVLGVAGLYIATFVFVEQFIGLNDEMIIVNSLIFALFILILDVICLRFRDDVIGEAPVYAEIQPEVVSDEKVVVINTDTGLINQLQTAMDAEKLYRQEGLTIGDVANTVGLQEYRLRQLINQQLGYRNFNDYLNTYRIQEACQRLEKENAQKAPVLNIAMDVGFRSLSAFNRAFKDRTGKTPRQYRESA